MKTSTAAKNSTALQAINTATGEAMTKAASLKACTDTLAKAVTALKSTFQAFDRLEPVLRDACVAAMNHAAMYRDARPADQIVRNVTEIGKATNRANQARILVAEIVSWFRAHSPIYWDAQGKVHVYSVGEKGYKDFKTADAQAEAFYERPAAKRAREAAARATERALNPVDADMLRNRIYGLKTFLASAEKPDANGKVRGVINARKLTKLVNDIIALTDAELGTATPEGTKKAEEQIKSTLIRKGSRKHRMATAKARKPKANGTAETVTAQAA